jgi:hypothetical protein
MSHSCDNPDCESSVRDLGHHISIGDSVFCSMKCKEEFLLWVVAFARQKSRGRMFSVAADHENASRIALHIGVGKRLRRRSTEMWLPL